jgi:hypothetical protein
MKKKIKKKKQSKAKGVLKPRCNNYTRFELIKLIFSMIEL